MSNSQDIISVLSVTLSKFEIHVPYDLTEVESRITQLGGIDLGREYIFDLGTVLVEPLGTFWRENHYHFLLQTTIVTSRGRVIGAWVKGIASPLSTGGSKIHIAQSPTIRIGALIAMVSLSLLMGFYIFMRLTYNISNVDVLFGILWAIWQGFGLVLLQGHWREQRRMTQYFLKTMMAARL